MTGGGESIAVVGAGSWGTALAVHLARIGHDVRLWARDPGIVDRIGHDRENRSYLPGIRVPDRVTATPHMAAALTGARFVVFAVPSHGLRAVARAGCGAIPPDAVLVSATKGIEPDSLQRMSEVLMLETGGARSIVVLSGPTFASEMARELPTVAVAASTDSRAVARVQE
jgi:glycerol-3-phosphate dehydrogenase (NAD(P)+)